MKKVIKPSHSPEKVQIAIHEAEDLYREIRVENELTDDEGTKFSCSLSIDNPEFKLPARVQ